ncbi:hypothetical protein GS934_02495 [Rhodococcus hoagii]|nr:hypothetical protein [Prescottella equi]NKZ86947.1 hypothetical protein [Prescottella equi]
MLNDSADSFGATFMVAFVLVLVTLIPRSSCRASVWPRRPRTSSRS